MPTYNFILTVCIWLKDYCGNYLFMSSVAADTPTLKIQVEGKAGHNKSTVQY